MSTRREFSKFLGKATLGSLLIPTVFQSCSNYNNVLIQTDLTSKEKKALESFRISGIAPTDMDDVVLAPGLDHYKLISWGEKINDTQRFGFNNDFTCFVPLSDNNPDEGLLWVNHEDVDRIFFSNSNSPSVDRPKEQVVEEMKAVGGSIVRIKKIDGKWQVQLDNNYNRRLDAFTPIPLNWDEPIAGSEVVKGTNSNCSGGLTPWGTILTCEENYDSYFGETVYLNGQKLHKPGYMDWSRYFPFPPEHYGWVVEVDPWTGKAQKHIALGRFAHECCTVHQLEDGRIVAYTGDDRNNQFIYKFISKVPQSLKEGTLYVANTREGKWLPLDWSKNEILKKNFSSQTEVLVRCREAAKLIGASPQNRPEDIEIDPLTGHVIITLTNNTTVNDHHGSILKIMESEGNYESLTFSTDTMASGGVDTGFSCPDNLIFDLSGNLWFTSDITGSKMNMTGNVYESFQNNGLFVMIRHGQMKGEIIQIASAPTQAEFTGPWFSPDFKSLFLSVQHPGELMVDRNNPTSTWPHDGDNLAKPSVIVLEGPLLNKLNHLRKV